MAAINGYVAVRSIAASLLAQHSTEHLTETDEHPAKATVRCLAQLIRTFTKYRNDNNIDT